MKKKLFTLASALLLPLLAMAQGWPANYGGVMLQGFFWDSWTQTPINGPQGGALNYLNYEEDRIPAEGYTWATLYGANWGEAEEWQVPLTTWNSLMAHINDIAPYIDLLWLPQSGSTICPPTTIFNKSQDTSGRNAVRAWRRGSTFEFQNDNVINQPDCMGFVPVFYFHHGEPGDGTTWDYTYYFGENNQEHKTFTPKSYFGTQKELTDLITAYKNAGTGAVEDVVANHRGCFGTWNFDFIDHGGTPRTYYASKGNLDFPEEDYTGQFSNLGWDAIISGQTQQGTERITWDLYDVCSDDESNNFAPEGHKPLGGPDCGGQGEWARDIQHHNKNTRAKVVKYLDFLRNGLGYLGFRYDYAMGFEGVHYAEYNTILRPPFSVGEYWGSLTDIAGWIGSTSMEGNYQSAAFDFPLMNAINEAFNSTRNNQQGWFRNLKDAGLIGDHDMRRYAVTFVDNHDTFKDLPTDGSNYNYQHRTNYNVLEANAFILAMPGTPCLFYPHFMHGVKNGDNGWHKEICKMIKARRTAGVHNMSEMSYEDWGDNGVKWIIEGTRGSLCFILGNGAEYIPEGYTPVWQSSICSFCINNELANEWQGNTKSPLITGYPIISRSTCAFNSNITVNVKPSLNGITLVYTTDGIDPTPNSAKITNVAGENLTFNETTQLKVGVLTGDVVQSIVSNTYVENGSDANSVTIYVKADDAPNLYLWSNKSDYKPNGGWAGNKTTEMKTVGDTQWHCKTFPLPNYSEGEYYNLIINWDGNSQSHTITGITSDRYFTYYNGQPKDVTEKYLGTVLTLTADKESGIYDGNLSVNVGLQASISDATIVYTIDGSEPSSSNGTQVSGGNASVTITGAGSHVLRAGILKDGQVINQIARTYIIANTNSVIEEGGINLFVRETGGGTPYVHYWPVEANSAPSSSAPEAFTKVMVIDGQTWYYRHFDTEKKMNFIFTTSQGNWNDSHQTQDITNVGPGNHFYEYTANNASYVEKTVSIDENNPITVYVDSNWQPYIYAWTGDGDNAVKYAGNWPGTHLLNKTHQTSDNKSWYEWTIFGLTNIKVILNDGAGGGQTGTIELGPGAHYLIYNNNNGVDHNNYNDVTSNYTHRISDITDASLTQIGNSGHVDKYYTINENLTVGYVYDNAIYAFDASVDADEMQHPTAIDYVNQVWGPTSQYDWVKITGFSDIDEYQPGTVMSNVTGKLVTTINPCIKLVVDPIKQRVDDTPRLNTYTPCNFDESQTQTSPAPNTTSPEQGGNGQTYYFYHPQANEVAHIRGAVYKGNGVFEVPEKEFAEGHWINGAHLTGSITVDINNRVTDDAIGKAVDFDALITLSGAKNDNYNIKVVDAGSPYIVATPVTDVKQAAKVTSVRYFNLQGMSSDTPFQGINIVVTTYDDGSRTSSKQLFR